MNKFQLFLSFLCICLLGGCSEEDEAGGIRLTDGTTSNQTILQTKQLLMAAYISLPTGLGQQK